MSRPMYSKLSTVARSGSYVEIAFENNHQMTVIRMTEENAANLVKQLESKVNEVPSKEKSLNARTS